MIKAVQETTTWYITDDGQRFLSKESAITHNHNINMNAIKKELITIIFDYNTSVSILNEVRPGSTILFLNSCASSLIPILERCQKS